MRALCSSAMAALVIVALFWGNCLSCPQILLSLKAHHPAHDCCKRGQKPAGKTCDARNLGPFVKSDAGSGTQAPPDAAVAMAAPAALLPEAAVAVRLHSAVHSPPDLLSLHSSLRI